MEPHERPSNVACRMSSWPAVRSRQTTCVIPEESAAARGVHDCVTLNAQARRVILALAVGFHLGTAAFMGLVTFASFMIAADLLFVPKEDYQRLGSLLRRLSTWFTTLYVRWRGFDSAPPPTS